MSVTEKAQYQLEGLIFDAEKLNTALENGKRLNRAKVDALLAPVLELYTLLGEQRVS